MPAHPQQTVRVTVDGRPYVGRLIHLAQPWSRYEFRNGADSFFLLLTAEEAEQADYLRALLAAYVRASQL